METIVNKNQTQAPLCLHCQHKVVVVVGRAPDVYCQHPDAVRDAATGALFKAEYMRGAPSAFCGPKALAFSRDVA